MTMDEILFLLKKEKLLTESSLKIVSGFMEKWSVNSFYAVIECNLITESEMADLISREMKLDRIYRLTNEMIELKRLSMIPFLKAVKYDAIPLRLVGDDTFNLEIVIANPADGQALAELEDITKCRIIPVVTELKSIRNLVQEVYPIEDQIPSLK